MLTVKLQNQSGAEEILCGKSVGFNPRRQMVVVAGCESIPLQEGDVAYVMNQCGKTVSTYHYRSQQ